MTFMENQTENQYKKLNVLLADDSSFGVCYPQRCLLQLGYKVNRVYNGQEAVTYCLNNPDVDLVLMDILMPLMDGIEATREIRKFNKDLIIIAMAAHEVSREYVIENGCNDLIEKPWTLETLQAVINKNHPKRLENCG